MTLDQKERAIQQLCRAVDKTMERLEIDSHQSYVSQKGIKSDLEELRFQLTQLQDSLEDKQPFTLEALGDIALRQEREQSGTV